MANVISDTPVAAASLSSTAFSASPANMNTTAGRALSFAAQFWFLVAVVGQWIFLVYIVAFYGGASAQGGAAAESAGVMTHESLLNNMAHAAHILMSAVIFVSGPLQLMPQVRNRLPRFHRANGRVYLVTVLIASLAGLYMQWTRDIPGGLVLDIAITIDAILIIAFGALALRYALARKLDIHRRWALRLFMVVSAVWFFRIGLMFWVALNQGPVGFDSETLTGPTITFLSFGQYLIPLAVLELYFRARDRAGATTKFAVSGVIVVLTLAMAFGIFAAAMGMWLPRMA